MKKQFNSFSVYLFVLLAIPLFFGVFSPDVAHAKSKTLERSFSDKLISSSGFSFTDGTGWWLQGTRAQITYNVSVLDKATGAVIPEDATVSVGQDITLKFEEHKGTDIYWFTNVGSKARITSSSVHIDSPYGSWKQNAAEPDVIDEDDYLGKALIGIHTTSYTCDKCARDGNESIRYKYAAVYAALTANHPTKTIETPSNLTCESLSGVDSSGVRTMQCKVDADGPININFKFSDTYGKFYSPTLKVSGESEDIFTPTKPYNQMPKISGSCYTWDGQEHCTYQGQPFTLTIPETSISYTLNASAVPNDPPSPPTITAPDSVCVNNPITITLSDGIDPDGDDIRYGLAYEGESKPTEWTPFIESGWSDSVTHTWSTAGDKTIKALTQDKRLGLSTWTSKPIEVKDSSSDPACDEDITVTLTADPDGDPPPPLNPGTKSTLTWSTTGNPDTCTASGGVFGGWSGSKDPDGGEEDVYPSITTTYTITCKKSGHPDATDNATVTVQGQQCVPGAWRCLGDDEKTSGCEILPCPNCTDTEGGPICSIPGTASISVDPTRVRSGNTTEISWKVSGKEASECMIGGTNGDTLDPLPELEGTWNSIPITAQTTYVLICDGGLSDEATVNVVPSYQEI